MGTVAFPLRGPAGLDGPLIPFVVIVPGSCEDIVGIGSFGPGGLIVIPQAPGISSQPPGVQTRQRAHLHFSLDNRLRKRQGFLVMVFRRRIVFIDRYGDDPFVQPGGGRFAHGILSPPARRFQRKPGKRCVGELPGGSPPAFRIHTSRVGTIVVQHRQAGIGRQFFSAILHEKPMVLEKRRFRCGNLIGFPVGAF